jgi:hypothetical protein
MSRILIPHKINDMLKSAKLVHESPSEEYEKLVAEANERIQKERRKEAEAWIHASTYISD